MNPLKYSFIILVIIALFLPFSCKKDKGKTVSISFDITGRILSDCDSTPIPNYPLSILVPCIIYEKSDNSISKNSSAVTSEFRTDLNGYYHIQTTLVINNVFSVSNEYDLVNRDILNGLKVFSRGPGTFTFTNGTLRSAYLIPNPGVVFNNCSNLIIKSNSTGIPYDSIAPIYLHKSNIRDSSLNQRVWVYSKNGAIASNDSLLTVSKIDTKTWYTYETRKKIGSSILFIKDSFFTRCKTRILINL